MPSLPSARQDRGPGNVPELSQHRIQAPVSVTAPGHCRGSQARPFQVFLAPKSRCRDGRECISLAPLPLLLSLLWGGKQGDFASSRCVTRGLCPQGYLTATSPPHKGAGKRGAATGTAKLTYFGGQFMNFTIFCPDNPKFSTDPRQMMIFRDGGHLARGRAASR